MLQHATFHILTFLSRNRDRWPRWIINAGLFAAGLIVAGLWLSITHPAAGEIWQNQLISLLLLAVTLFAAGMGFLIVRGIMKSLPEVAADMLPPLPLSEKIYNTFGRRVLWLEALEKKAAVRTLPASTWTPPDASPDILVCNLPGEGPEQFAARMDDAIEQANVARWVVVLKRGFPAGMIFGAPDAAMEFLRDWPPFQTETWLPEQRIVPMGTRFRDETEDDFQEYVERFMEHFPEWAQRKKITGEKTRAGFVFQQVIKAASVVFFLLFSVATFAQKAEKVNATPIAGKVPPAGEKVAYIFAQTDLYRTADGRKTFAELLTALPGYRNGGGGELIAVMVDGKSVYKAEQTGDVAQQPATRAATMRPHSETVNPDNLGRSFSMPDSAGMAEMAEMAQYEIWKAGKQASAMARPWWEVVMAAFWVVYPVLLILSVVAWVFARVFASEGMIREHKWARRALVVILLSVAAVVLVNLMLWAISTGAGPLPLTLFGGVLAIIAYYIVSRLTPNFNPARGNEPERGMFGRGNYPQLNG